jgi:hypothetical protein
LKKVIEKHNIEDEDIWNIDKKGFRLSIRKLQKRIIYQFHYRKTGVEELI